MSYSHDINLDTWVDLVGFEPAAGVDSLGHYRGHALDEGSAATFTVSATYTVGTELVLKLHFATASVSKGHAWEASVILNGGTPEVFSEDFTSGSLADAMTYESMAISSSGAISSVAIQAGDVVEVTLSRVAAVSNEDPADIRLYAVAVGLTLADIQAGDCVGRVGEMIAQVRLDFNEALAKIILDGHIIMWFNRGLKRLVRYGLFRKESELATQVGVESYNLLTYFADFVDAKAIRDPDLTYFSYEVQYPYKAKTFNEYQQLKYEYELYTGLGVRIWCVENNTMWMYPVPTEVKTYNLLHTYAPTALSCTDNPDPIIPSAYDDFFVATAMGYAHKRRYASAGSGDEANFWLQEAERLFAEICYQAAPRGLTINIA